MRRSICYCEPNQAIVGEVRNWKFVYTTSSALPKGTSVKFDLLSRSRTMDWQIPNLSSKSNLIWLELPNKKTIKAENRKKEEDSAFEFTLPFEVKAGESFAILLGSQEASTKTAKNGNSCQCYVQRRRSFLLFLDPKGKKNYGDPEIFHLDVKGASLQNLRILAPSLVARNQRFDVIIRFEDAYNNLTGNAPPNTLIELSYENLRENLHWKLFVPETGFLTLPNLYFNEVGVFRIQLKNLHTKESFFSAPIKCLSETNVGIYWGLLHGESERFTSGEEIESCLRYFRDEKALQFFATSSFDGEEETSLELWKMINHQVMEFNEEDRFITFLGLQWHSDEEGLRHLIFSKDNKPILRSKDNKYNSLKKIYKAFSSKELLSIPSFTMGEKSVNDFSDFSPEFERVVEIYNAWGSSECPTNEGNLRPILAEGKDGFREKVEGSVRKALSNNCRFGFVAGGLEDRGFYEPLYDSSQVQYSPGLTAIVAKGQTREALMEALQRRHCYATTGERIILWLTLAGELMGSELDVEKKPGLEFNRHLSGFVAGTSELKEVQIFRNGKLLTCFTPSGTNLDFTFDDSERLSSSSTLPQKEGKGAFVYYYLRVVQKDGHIGWSSPIWVDCPSHLLTLSSSPNKKSAPLKKKKKKK